VPRYRRSTLNPRSDRASRKKLAARQCRTLRATTSASISSCVYRLISCKSRSKALGPSEVSPRRVCPLHMTTL